MFTELQKWQLVNQAKTTTLLEQAIKACSDENGYIVSSHIGRPALSALQQMNSVKPVVHEGIFPNQLTGQYGIRQQALYLIHYQKP